MMQCAVDQHRMLLLTVSPRAAARVDRLAYAIDLIRAGNSRLDVRCAVQRRFAVSKVSAWRTTTMAFDIAGPVS